MPGVTPNSTTYPNQVDQSSQAPTTQKNLRAMVGEVYQWNPDLSPDLIIAWINNHYRKVVDKRLWYGMLIRGQIVVPSVYSAGAVSVVNGSQTVTGVGTAFTQAMVGFQMRIGFTTGWATIQAVPDATHLTLDLPWGHATQSGAGYQILNNLVSPGPNIKFIKEIVNQRQGYRLLHNMPQRALNNYDTWRTSTGWTWMLANREPSAKGWPQYELYPAPTFQQAFPYLAYVQPPDMVADNDFPVGFIRSDIIVNFCIKDALTFRGPKLNKYYDINVAKEKEGEAVAELITAINNDDLLYSQDTGWEYSRWPMSQYGALFMQSHASVPGEGDAWG